MELDCVAQTYAWGIKGNSSLVAKVKSSINSDFVVKANESYAELWMGTHPSGPAKLKGSDMLLSSYLSDKAASVGIVPQGYPTNDLPFLFKILSVNTALSIQTHPDKSLAQELHKNYPDIYKDSNHKPEMVIALTRFECLCGFNTLHDICNHLLNFPEFKNVIVHNSNGDIMKDITSDREDSEQLLRLIFTSYITCDESYTKQQLQIMIIRLQAIEEAATTAIASSSLLHHHRPLTSIESLILRLHSQYPSDIGVFSPLLMNYIVLQKGHSFFIGANELHAYISGECIECMALSDNVVRAGLTPKYKDSATLCKMLNYRSQLPSLLNPIYLDPFTALYRPPLDSCAEFEVEITLLPPHTIDHRLIVIPSGSIILIMREEKRESQSCSSGIVDGTGDGGSGDIGDGGDSSADSGSGDSRGVALIARMKASSNSDEVSIVSTGIYYIPASEIVTITTYDQSVSIYRAHINLGI